LFKGKKKSAQQQQKGAPISPQSQDVLVQDPVCKTYIPRGQAITLQVENEEKCFCSEKCRDAFLKAPEKDTE